MTTLDISWDAAVDEFRERFTRAPRGTHWRLGGTNFMTPERLGLVLDPDGHVVEVSTGMFVGKRYYGVTWDRLPDDPTDERSTSCETLAEAHAVIYPEETS